MERKTWRGSGKQELSGDNIEELRFQIETNGDRENEQRRSEEELESESSDFGCSKGKAGAFEIRERRRTC
jgi:hypothetical protein